ncbi:MAG: FAD-dependent oxidoreductase [Desulfocapsaceae bacterium]|nr:FAD-dependent oxidoreductase [Desulfocapsaceae bacterium]
MFPEKSDIAIIGGGSAGLALAFHLAEQGNDRLSVTIVESRSDYQNDRTWCFWDFNELHEKLRPIIRKSWQNWSFSKGERTIVHHSAAHPYCAVSAGDYYEKVLACLRVLDNFTIVKNCQATSITTHKGGYLIATSQGEMWSRYIIDTRPPIHDYHLKKSSPSAPSYSEVFSGAILYQIFFGVEVELDYDFFDDSTVQLMANLTEAHNGLAFRYVLPYSANRALVEYTTFTPHFFAAQQLKSDCLSALEQLLGKSKFEIVYEEGAVLPMGFGGVKSSRSNLLYAGIVGGSVRDSTGFAFIRTQRWAARCAADLAKGRLSKSMACDTRVDEFMDKTFLRVLRKHPQLAPKLFMSMAQNLSAETFARFMMEKSTWPDYLRVIMAMPKKVFFQQIISTSG